MNPPAFQVIWQPGDAVEAAAQASHHLAEVGVEVDE